MQYKKNGYGGKDKHLKMHLIFSFSKLKKCIKDKIPPLFCITKSTMFALILSISLSQVASSPQAPSALTINDSAASLEFSSLKIYLIMLFWYFVHKYVMHVLGDNWKLGYV